jgi:hypothetical protein
MNSGIDLWEELPKDNSFTNCAPKSKVVSSNTDLYDPFVYAIYYNGTIL